MDYPERLQNLLLELKNTHRQFALKLGRKRTEEVYKIIKRIWAKKVPIELSKAKRYK